MRRAAVRAGRRQMTRARSRSVPSSASREVCSQSRSSAAKSSAPGFLGAAGARVGELAHARQRPLVRRVAALPLVLLRERERGLGDLRAAGGELRDRLLREPGDHPALGRGPVRPPEPEPAGQPGLQRERGQRGPGALLPVQAAGVDRPPLAVADRLDLVQPQHVDVQLRVAVAAGVLREDRHRDLARVLEPAGLQRRRPADRDGRCARTWPRAACARRTAGRTSRSRPRSPPPGPPTAAAACRSPACRASTADASALACAREMVLSTENVVSKYCTPTGPSYSARASASSRIRSSAVAPGWAASFAW